MEKDFPKDRSYTGESDKDVDKTDEQLLLEVQILSLKEEIEKDEKKSPKTIEEKERLQRDKERLKELEIELSDIRNKHSKSAPTSTDKPPVSEFSFANLPLPNVSTGRLLGIFNDLDSTRHQRSETRQSTFLSNLLDKSCETTALEQFMSPPQTEQADLPSTTGLSNVAGSLSSSEDSSHRSDTSPGDDSPITSDETLPSEILEHQPSTSYAILETRPPDKGPVPVVVTGKKGKGLIINNQYVTKLSPLKPATNSPIKPSHGACSPTETKTLEVKNQSPKSEFVARTSPSVKRKISNPKRKDCDESCTGISTDSQLSETRSCDELKILKKLKFEDEDANKQFPTLTEERQPLDLPNTGVISNVVGFTSISNSEESSLTSGSGEIIPGEREDSSLTNVSDISPENDSPITSLGEETSTSGNSELQHSPSIDTSPKPMDEMAPVTNMEL